MTNYNPTDSQLERIIECADEVLSALAGTNEDAHRDNSTKMCGLWDDLNDTHAPPEVVRAMARAIQEHRKAAGKIRRFELDMSDCDSCGQDCGADMVEDVDGEYVLLEEVIPYLYQHAEYTPQPAPVLSAVGEPVAWLNDAYLGRGVVDGEAGREDAGPGYIPVYRHPQNAAPAAESVPDVAELESILSWILHLPVPTHSATLNAKRLKAVIDSFRADRPQPVSNRDELTVHSVSGYCRNHPDTQLINHPDMQTASIPPQPVKYCPKCDSPGVSGRRGDEK